MTEYTRVEVSIDTPLEDRVYQFQSAKLIGSPTPDMMRTRFGDGVKVIRTGERLVCPHKRDSRGPFTTLEADRWFNEELNRLEGLS